MVRGVSTPKLRRKSRSLSGGSQRYGHHQGTGRGGKSRSSTTGPTPGREGGDFFQNHTASICGSLDRCCHN